MKKGKILLNAVTLRYVLIALLVILLIGGGAGFVFVYDKLVSFNKETLTLEAQISMSDSNLDALRKIQAYLDTNQDAVTKASKLVADTKEYKYQNDIIDDIYKFASESGVSLLSISFDEGAASGGAGSTTPQPGTTTPAPQSTAVSGLTSKTANVTIRTPVNYTNLLKFIRKIEQNQTKMQIASISLAKGESANTVSSEAFTIEVYTR